MDKALAISQLIAQLVQLGETEFAHIWTIIHTVKEHGTQGAVVTATTDVPPIPKG